MAKKLSSVGGPSRAWWFRCRALMAHIRKAREVLSMPPEDFLAEYGCG